LLASSLPPVDATALPNILTNFPVAVVIARGSSMGKIVRERVPDDREVDEHVWALFL
jgi:hypothetical protein